MGRISTFNLLLCSWLNYFLSSFLSLLLFFVCLFRILNIHKTYFTFPLPCVLQNCKIHHSVIGLRSCISEGAIIEDTLLMGADYYETDADRRFLAAKGSVPIGIGKNSHIKRAIIDKNARIGDNVKILNTENVQEAARETDGYFIKSGIVTVIKDALIPSGTVI